MGSARLGEFIHSAPPTPARPVLHLPLLYKMGGDGRAVPLSQGPGAGSPPLPPLHGCVTVGRSRLPAAQSGPLAARRIAAPPWPILPASGARFPPAQSAPGPAPSARGSHPTITQDPLTTLVAHHPLCPDPTLLARSPRPSLRKYLWLRRAGAEHWLRPWVQCVRNAAPRHNLESLVPHIPG